MHPFVAALPMYDWPEIRGEVDAQWASLRDRLRQGGVDAPERLARANSDLPPVKGGIRDARGTAVAPDPSTLPAAELDLFTLWRHPALLFGQACWGPMEAAGLADHVTVVGQPDYSDVEGGEGACYSSAILMRREGGGESVAAPRDGRAVLPLDRLRGMRLAFNEPHSMSGRLALERDLGAHDATLDIFSGFIETGGHRASIVAVAQGRAEVCAVDCRSWALAKAWEPAAEALRVVGWTGRRKGLPYISARSIPAELTYVIQDIVSGTNAETPR